MCKSFYAGHPIEFAEVSARNLFHVKGTYSRFELHVQFNCFDVVWLLKTSQKVVFVPLLWMYVIRVAWIAIVKSLLRTKVTWRKFLCKQMAKLSTHWKWTKVLNFWHKFSMPFPTSNGPMCSLWRHVRWNIFLVSEMMSSPYNIQCGFGHAHRTIQSHFRNGIIRVLLSPTSMSSSCTP